MGSAVPFDNQPSSLFGLRNLWILGRFLGKSDTKLIPSATLLYYGSDDRWDNLERYAQDGNGEMEIDNNFVENSIRPTAIGKKNWLFIGHPKAGQVSAIIYTIIENCCMNMVNPYEYLVDVLPRIQDHPANRVNELLPRQWAEAKAETKAQEAKEAA